MFWTCHPAGLRHGCQKAADWHIFSSQKAFQQACLGEPLTDKLRISAFFPAYNDAMTISSVVIATVRTLRQITDDFEVIVVDDGSQDGTREILAELQSLYPDCLRVERHPRNRGYGGAVRTGIASATKDWIFYTDGDAQYDVRELALLAEKAGDGVDVVNGYKIARSDPSYRKFLGWGYNLFVHLAFGLRIRDVDCDFRLMRRSLFERIELHSDSGTICVEMIKKLQDVGSRFSEVPVHHYHRSVGRSYFFRPYWLWKTLRDLLALWYELMVRGAAPVTVPASAPPAAVILSNGPGRDDPS